MDNSFCLVKTQCSWEPAGIFAKINIQKNFRKMIFGKIKVRLPKLNITRALLPLLAVLVVVSAYLGVNTLNQKKSNEEIERVLSETRAELTELKNQDQIKTNQELKERIKKIEETYGLAVSTYEDLLDLKAKSKDTAKLDKLFAEVLSYLSKQNYASASGSLANLQKGIKEEEDKVVASFTIPANAPVSNTPPGAGYSSQQVGTDVGSFLVSMVAGDLASTRVIVDTASAGDCANDCPVLSLADYVSRNGAYAGVNGSYFCPATYPTCAGKTNTFDTLLMNKDKVYFNSGNNVYSNNPAVIFGGSYIRFVGAASQWGRDTGIDSMISNYPLLVSGGNVSFGGDDDPKKGSKGARSFVANRGNTVYIGVVFNATVAESARALKALGMENALNLDDGGSTALWSGGYKAGPGRALPNVILFVRK